MTEPVTAQTFSDIVYAPHLQAGGKISMIVTSLGRADQPKWAERLAAYKQFKEELHKKIDVLTQLIDVAETPLDKLAGPLLGKVRDFNNATPTREITQQFSTLDAKIHDIADKLKNALDDINSLRDIYDVVAVAEDSADELEMKQFAQFSEGNSVFLENTRSKIPTLLFGIDQHYRAFRDEFILSANARFAHKKLYRSIDAFAEGPGHDVAAPEKATFKAKPLKMKPLNP